MSNTVVDPGSSHGSSSAPQGRRPVLRAFIVSALLGLCVVAGLGKQVAGDDRLAFAFAVCGYGVASLLAARLFWRTYPHARLGLCNIVTQFRAAIAASLFACALSLTPGGGIGWSVVAIALLGFVLDGVDGWLARARGLVSDFGARFDMEVDAALALALALIAEQSGKVGPMVLILGLMRYGFLFAALWLPWLRAPLPQRFRRKAICVVQIAALLILISPVASGAGAQMLAASASALLIWSFAIDVIWLWRRRP